MADIRAIAKFFLSKESMSHKKLQKLCYYAQAWYLANYGIPLIPNRFEAWVHGPVSPDLYVEYKEWGWLNIPKYIGDIDLTEQEIDFLNKVFHVYGKYSGDELETITHNEIPWRNARKGCSPSAYSRNPILWDDMKKCYGERINKSYA